MARDDDPISSIYRHYKAIADFFVNEDGSIIICDVEGNIVSIDREGLYSNKAITFKNKKNRIISSFLVYKEKYCILSNEGQISSLYIADIDSDEWVLQKIIPFPVVSMGLGCGGIVLASANDGVILFLDDKNEIRFLKEFKNWRRFDAFIGESKALMIRNDSGNILYSVFDMKSGDEFLISDIKKKAATSYFSYFKHSIIGVELYPPFDKRGSALVEMDLEKKEYVHFLDVGKSRNITRAKMFGDKIFFISSVRGKDDEICWLSTKYLQ